MLCFINALISSSVPPMVPQRLEYISALICYTKNKKYVINIFLPRQDFEIIIKASQSQLELGYFHDLPPLLPRCRLHLPVHYIEVLQNGCKNVNLFSFKPSTSIFAFLLTINNSFRQHTIVHTPIPQTSWPSPFSGFDYTEQTIIITFFFKLLSCSFLSIIFVGLL